MNKYLSIIIVIVITLFVTTSYVNAIENTFEVSATVIESPIVIPTTTPVVNENTSRSGSKVLMTENLVIDSSHNSALIEFDTSQSTQAKVFWGITKDYEIGSISGLFYSFDHSVKIFNLHSDMKYFYKIEVTNIQGIKIVTEGIFQTQKDYNFISVANVTHFQAIAQDKDVASHIALSWNIPDNRDISSVRIIRSDRFFPRDINDGEIIYEGYSEKYNDKKVIKDKTYYYAIFTKDSKNNYSSGVLAQARILTKNGQSATSSSTNPFEEIPIVQSIDSVIKALLFKNFDFIQDNKKIENDGEMVTVDGSKNLTILLDYDRVPEILKTIVITLTDPDDSSKIFSFLLKVDEGKIQYQATVAPLGRSGKYKINILVLDYKNQGLKRLQGTLNVLLWKKNENLFKNCGIFDEVSKCTELSAKNKIIAYSTLFILILIVVLGFVLKQRENKK